MVKVKPVGQDGQNGPVGQDELSGQDGQNGPVGQDGQIGPVGQNCYPQELYLYSDNQNLWLSPLPPSLPCCHPPGDMLTLRLRRR